MTAASTPDLAKGTTPTAIDISWDGLKPPLAVFAHDAGAGNILQAWLQVWPLESVFPSMAGPALRAFTQGLSHRAHYTPSQALERANCVLTGTGWQTDYEWEALAQARDMGKRSAAVCDHWVNYAERFVRRGVWMLPDEIWVTDHYAMAIARAVFAEVAKAQPTQSAQPQLRLKRNLYWRSLLEQIEALHNADLPADTWRVLYTLEPIRNHWPGFSSSFGRSGNEPGEFHALDYFAAHVEAHRPAERASMHVRLRPHPSDPIGKYEEWIAAAARRRPNWTIEIDPQPQLSASIAWSECVVGCETMALAIAHDAHRQVWSSLPPGAPACRLPHQGIRHLRDAAVQR